MVDSKFISCKWSGCTKKSSSSVELVQHIKTIHVKCKFSTECKWDDCDVVATSKWNLINHVNSHLNIVRGACHICDKQFKWKGDMNRHLRQHTPDERLFNEVVSELFK